MVSIGALLNPAGGTPSVAAPSPGSGSIAEVRSFPTSDHGVEHPSGLAWSDAQASLVIAESKADATALHAVRPDETGLGGTTVAEADGASLAVDPSDGRVTLLCGEGEVGQGATTVLAQNDSGVGVKNGVNAFGVKNFLGTFAPPFAVLNDFAFLETLDDRDWRAGISEAVKVALIKDAAFYNQIKRDAAI